MAVVTTQQQGFPQIGAPLVNPTNGIINQTWLQLLIALWNRTGGASGGGGGDEQILTSLALVDQPTQLLAHTNLWTAGQIFNYTGGTTTKFRNTNPITPATRNTGWFSNTVSPGNFIFSEGRILIGEAILNAGSSVRATGNEWVENISPSTVRLAQLASVNTTGGIGLLGASRTSDSPDVGPVLNQGTQGITAIVYNDNLTSLQTCYGFYGEAWKSASTQAENIAQVAEFTSINLYSTSTLTNPYNTSPTGLIETLRVATGKGTAGNTASTGICIVGTGPTSAVFQNGIIISSNALTSANRAICLAKGHLVTWFKSNGTGSSHVRCDVDTGQLGYRVVFGDATVNFQDETNTNLWTWTTPPNGQVNVNQYACELHGALVYLNTTQNIPDSTDTAISFSAANYDTDGFWSGGSPTLLTIPTGKGITKVRVSCNIQYNGSSAGARNFQINYNGSGNYIGRVGMAGDAASTSVGFSLNGTSAIINVSDGDTFELHTSQNSGFGLAVQALNTWMAIEVVG